MKGKKVRIAPVEMVRWIMETLEANAVVMPVTEVYLAIQQGTVPGAGEPGRHDLLAALLRGREEHHAVAARLFAALVAIADRTFQSLSEPDARRCCAPARRLATSIGRRC
jgi:TRAP-type C4-dicarboxylate transport system substrate-binding protein